MKEKWFKIYESMLQELEACARRRLDQKTEIENCFNISQKYWTQIQTSLENQLFLSVRDEIEFYKTVKPLFKSHIEYYNLLYQAVIFIPLDNRMDIKEYWLKELQKLDRFILANRDFYAYYKSGATDRDEEYYLSAGQTVYFDDLIATLIALEKYYVYVQKQLVKN